MKHKVSLLAILLMALTIPFGAQASYDFTAVAPSGQTLYYHYYGGGVYLTRPGYSWSVYTAPTGFLTIPSTVTYNGTTYSVVGISEEAFKGCSSLTSVTIPNSVTYIGRIAFSGVRHIEYYGTATGAPWGANYMNGVTDGDFIFSNTNNDTLISYIGVGGAVSIPSGVTSIGNYAFYGCNNLSSISIPNSTNSIGNFAFYSCIGLTSINIPNNITAIGDASFSGCLRLMSIRLGDAVASIGNYAFKECGIIGELVIPQSIITIGSGAFSECYGINEITALGRVAPTLGDYAFSGVDSNIVVNVPCNTTNLYAGRWPQFHNFNEIPFLFNAISENMSKGTVAVLQEPTCDEPLAVVQANPKTGYRFDHWSDGSTDNPYSYTVTGSGTLIAYFASTTAISDAETEEASIEVRDGVISVHGVQPTEVQVYNIAGRLVNHHARLAAGVYVVRIGQSVGKKIVVL